MQLTNNWKEELEKMECVFTNCDLWDMADRGGDSLPILYRDEVETFIQSLLETRTQEILEVVDSKIKNFVWDNGECSICGFNDCMQEEGAEHSCVEINMTLLKILSEIKSKFIQ